MSTHDRITRALLERLDRGTVPWRRPWTRGPPRNLVSGKAHRGVNALLLGAQPYEQPYWLTYRQAQRRGGTVRRGERGVTVIYWQPAASRRDDEDTNAHRALLRAYTVFNVAQCTAVEAPLQPARRDRALDAILAGMPHPPELVHTADHAAYRPATDTVVMPPASCFDSTEDYYATFLHELVHSTGHASRLCRPGITQGIEHGSPRYAREELVAEIGAAFLCGHAGIAPSTLDQNAAYIGHWRRVLGDHPRLVISSAASAQQAADYILDHRGESDDRMRSRAR